jgi:hypothetical protein
MNGEQASSYLDHLKLGETPMTRLTEISNHKQGTWLNRYWQGKSRAGNCPALGIAAYASQRAMTLAQPFGVPFFRDR